MKDYWKITFIPSITFKATSTYKGRTFIKGRKYEILRKVVGGIKDIKKSAKNAKVKIISIRRMW